MRRVRAARGWYWKPYSGKIVLVDVKIRDKGSLSEGKFYIKVDKYDSSFEVALGHVFKTEPECMKTIEELQVKGK